MQNLVQNGETLKYRCTGPVRGGQLIVFPDMVAVAAIDGEDGDLITLETTRVFLLPKVKSEAIGQGVRVYVNDQKEITATASSSPAGVAWADAAANSTEVAVKINV